MEIIARDEPIGTFSVARPELRNVDGEAVELETKQVEERWWVAGFSIQKPKIIRLYRCFGCDRNFALLKMSACLAICRVCLQELRTSDTRVAERSLDRTLGRIKDFFRRTA